MPSTIDSTKPIAGNPTTDSVRTNFSAAKAEIEALQSAVADLEAGAVPDATDAVSGIVELATPTEVNTGTDSVRAITPAGLEAWTGSSQVTQVGTITSGTWSGTTIGASKLPAASTAAAGIVELADSSETVAGSSSALAVTPAGLAATSLTKLSSVNTQTGTTYTLLSTDNGKDIVFTSATDVTVTIPGTLDVNFQCTCSKLGAGDVIFDPSADNVNGATANLTLASQWATAFLLQYSEGNWLVAGDVT